MFRCEILLLLAALCFSAISSNPDPNSTTGCAREYLLFELFTSEPELTVWNRFKDVQVLYSFKVYGAGQYLLVVKNDQSDALKNLALPNDAIHTASVIPVETLNTFLQVLDISTTSPNNPNRLPDNNLTMMEKTWPATDLNEDQYKATVVEMMKQESYVPELRDTVRLVAMGTLPTKFIYFWNIGDCRSAEIVMNTSDASGGPGHIQVRLLKLHNIEPEST